MAVPERAGNLPRSFFILPDRSGNLPEAFGNLSEASGDFRKSAGDDSKSPGNLPESSGNLPRSSVILPKAIGKYSEGSENSIWRSYADGGVHDVGGGLPEIAVSHRPDGQANWSGTIGFSQ